MCRRCLYCYQPLGEGETDYHGKCSRKLFGTAKPPELPYRRVEISELAKEVIRSQTTITGVQPKLSLDFDNMSLNPRRFTIVGLWGRYILKPQTEQYANLPELEDLTMHLAEDARIKTVPHGLIRFADGELCYITRRVDRTDDGGKIAMEDMCQLSERLTEDKYKGSYEGIARLIRRYSSVPALDLVNYWEQVVFAWITGNADMHLKNYSLYAPSSRYELSPAYDLLSTALVIPEDKEELALTLMGRKRKLTRENFVDAMTASGLEAKVAENIIRKFQKTQGKWKETIAISFVPEDMKQSLELLIAQRLERLTAPA